ncbi:MAG: BamA/TamA family outer membrane protein [Ferruginibacter sp.]
MKKIYLYSCVVLLFISSCSVRRFLPAGEKLYRGATVKIKKEKDVSTSARSLKSMLNSQARPKPNKFLLGQPWKVWWWYVIGEPKRPKGLKAFLRSKLGEPPVLSSRVNATASAENMQAYLENNGYFHSTVHGDTSNKSYFTKAIYTADVFPQYKIKSITWVNDSSEILKALTSFQRRSLLKVGNPYSLSDVEAERVRLDLRLKTQGYYYFNPDYLMAYADSTIGNREVNLFLNIKMTTPEAARHAYTINRITIFPNYTLVDPPPDTSKVGTENIDGLLIRDTVKKFRPVLFKRTVTYRPGTKYSSRNQNTTLNRFINLGAFKFVKNRFAPVSDTIDPYRLNVFYYLTPAKKRSISAEIDAFSKENKYIGSQVSVSWKNRNTFRGAEQLGVRLYGGFELSFADSLTKNNNYRIGGEATLTIPRFAIPFLKIKDSNLYPPITKFLTGYEYFIKQSYYTKNVFRFEYILSWKNASNKEHTLAPVSLTYLNASSVTDSFYKEALLNPSILLNVYSEAILGSYYTFAVHTSSPANRNQFYFSGGVDVSGNIAGLITGAKRPREKTIFSTPFAQYVKLDGDLRYKRRFRNKVDWANRLEIGIGMPYSNSALLPFSKQYIIGGANSVRGFAVRRVGPGSYLPTSSDLRFFQVIGGDYKLLANTELRFPLAGKLFGAVFTDVGNVWTKDTTLFGTAGQIKKDFLNELAVASGIGIRIDASILILRLDLGIPLRKPYLPDGHRWVLNQIDFGSAAWRRDNLILNLAIGYPF